MNIREIDLNLLVYLDTLLRERNVTRAAESLGISQPAMSNGLSRLRKLFNNDLLIRTSSGMVPTDRALAIQPVVRQVLAQVEGVIQPTQVFDALTSDRVFRISVSDYTESTLLPPLLEQLREMAPNIVLDVLTPSDVDFAMLEQGKVDLVINRFDKLPQSFRQRNVWRDSFSCLLSADNPIARDFTLDNYLKSSHVWVSKTGMGTGVGLNPVDSQHLGWVDEALRKLGHSRNIRVLTRHYQAAARLVINNDLIVTLPTRAAKLHVDKPGLVLMPPPFKIPSFDLTMAWSPLVHQNAGHKWFRDLVYEIASHN